MEKDTLKFVVVGHIDHGKSTLIGRLLYDTNSLSLDRIKEMKKFSKKAGKKEKFAFLLDHFREERKKRITIETSEIFFETKKRRCIIIDAPGHAEFIKNMVTGSSRSESAVLIVDVKEGVKEQTARHINILSLFGLKKIIVLLNKMDSVCWKESVFETVKKQTERILKRVGISSFCYIPISALEGDNVAKRSSRMEWYKGPVFLDALDFFERDALRKMRKNFLIFPIQDRYGKTAVGRIETGRIKRGEKVKVLPQERFVKIKEIKKFKKDLEEAKAGESVGIVVEGKLLERGDIICSSKEPKVVRDFNAFVFWMGKKPVREKESVFLRCATQERRAKIKQIEEKLNSSTLRVIQKNKKMLENLELGRVKIEVEEPIIITKFTQLPVLGRFVLEQNGDIYAGGIIL